MAEECLRCRGPLKADQERYGAYLSCIQCGYIRDQLAKAPLKRGEMVNARRRQLVGLRGTGSLLLKLRRMARVSPDFRERVHRLAIEGRQGRRGANRGYQTFL